MTTAVRSGPVAAGRALAAPGRSARQIRAELGHPVVDADGHVLELLTAVLPYVREELPAAAFEAFRSRALPVDDMVRAHSTAAVARATRVPQGAWWATPAANVDDLATATLPALLYDRMDDLGMDYAILYPTKALGVAAVEDPDVRRGVARGFNRYYAETYGPYQDRFRVAGIIPMHTPEEACDALDHARSVGLRVVVLPDGVVRPIERAGTPTNRLLPGQTHWLDTYGLDSAHDYDPVWARCADLGLAVNFHVGVGAVVPRVAASVTNYVFNHVGFFAERMGHLCKSLYLGGVTTRFPQLRFSFLEAGCGWACSLVADLVEHWERRSPAALAAHLDPALIDWDRFEGLVRRYGAGLIAGPDDWRAALRQVPATGTPPADRDDWRHLRPTSDEDVVGRFVDSFSFGCEADDRAVATAYSGVVPGGRTLRAMFSSDMGHWDAGDLDGVLAAAVGLLDRGALTEDQFAAFAAGNAIDLFTAADPAFFDGTALQGHVASRPPAGPLQGG
ncbi:MAG TPA: amidohydrolase family protein [Acidimicrobiales bacterium]|nr:amidohydrolase family protein [Acidimicrobiales bacterium]